MHVNANYCTASLQTPIKYVPNTGMTVPVTYVRYNKIFLAFAENLQMMQAGVSQ